MTKVTGYKRDLYIQLFKKKKKKVIFVPLGKKQKKKKKLDFFH